MGKASHDHFWPRVLSSDASHDLTALFGAHGVHAVAAEFEDDVVEVLVCPLYGGGGAS